MHLLITGGSGYLGAELVRIASERGWLVTSTYYLHPPASSAAHIQLDMRDRAAISRVFDELQPTAVIHTAYRQNDPDLWSVTVEGSAAVAQASRRHGVRLIHMSTDVVFDGEQTGRYTEQDQINPITAYGEAKAAAERFVGEHHPQALIARTSLIYGGAELSPHERLALDAADGHKEIAFFVDEMRCPVVVADLAAALLELVSLPVSGPLHIAGADSVSRYTFARLVAAAHGRSPDNLRSARSADQPVRRPRNCALDSQQAQKRIHTRLRGVYEVLGTI